MSLEQLKAALAKKQQSKSSNNNKNASSTNDKTPQSQITSKKPSKKSAGRGR